MSNPPSIGAHIFVVDNTPSNLVQILSILRRAGFTNALPFTDTGTALDAVGHVHPDLVLVDLDLPEDVWAFITALQTAGPSREAVPVLALVADGAGPALQRALSSGANGYVTKPIDESEIVLRVRNALGLDADAEAETPEDHNPDAETIRAVIERGGPDIALQPIVELATGKTVGVEALARFGTSPVPPNRWFELAAAVGLGVELELAAIAAALTSLERLDPAFRLAVNVSTTTVLDDRFHVLVNGPDLNRLAFELTRLQPVTDYEALSNATAWLRAHGALLCVDDASADYASLRHIFDLHPDVIKLDIAFTHDIDTDNVKRTYTTWLHRFAEDIGATLTAVGIETQAELDTMRGLGVDHGQGFFIARPAAVDRDDETTSEDRAALLEAIAAMIAGGRRVAALCVDIDDFREVNERFGRNVGDEVLRTVDARLQGTLRPGHIVAHLGGDGFVVVSDTLAGELEALSLGYRIRDVLARRIGFAKIQVEVTASVGIAFAVNDRPEDLLADAERTLAGAKRSGRGSVELDAARSSA